MTDIEAGYRDLMAKTALKRGVERTLLVFISVCLIGVIVILFFQNGELRTALTNQNNAKTARDKFDDATATTLENQSKQILNLEGELKTQEMETKGYVLCIGEFFDSTNRANESLNINTCSINGNPLPSSSTPDDSTTTEPKTTNQNASNTNNTTKTSTPTTSSGSTSSGSGSSTTPKPVTVLGIPVCIPLTKVCINH